MAQALYPPPLNSDTLLDTKVELNRFSNVWAKWFITLYSLLSSGFSGTIVTAKLTGGGANGSMTFQNGVLIASTPAT